MIKEFSDTTPKQKCILICIISDGIELLIKYLCSLFLAITVIVVMLQVILRYLFHSPIFWFEELTRYLLVWVSFLGLPIIYRHGEMACVDILVKKISAKNLINKVIVEIIVKIVILVSLFILGSFGVKLVMTPTIKHQLSPSMRMPMSVLYAAVPVGCFLTILQLLLNILSGTPRRLN